MAVGRYKALYITRQKDDLVQFYQSIHDLYSLGVPCTFTETLPGSGVVYFLHEHFEFAHDLDDDDYNPITDPDVGFLDALVEMRSKLLYKHYPVWEDEDQQKEEITEIHCSVATCTSGPNSENIWETSVHMRY